MSDHGIATRAIHADRVLESATRDVTPPIHTSSIHAVAPGCEPGDGYFYQRLGNPTRSHLEACLAALEGASAPGLFFSSGMAAIDAVFRLLTPGDTLVVARDVYGGTVAILHEVYVPLGIKVVVEDASDTEAFAAAIKPGTRMVWIESPSNPLLRLTDIAEVARAARSVGALVGIDNTFATPALQNPLALGCDIVMHSTTKYLGGHSDSLGGALVVDDAALRERLHAIQVMTGAVGSPFDSWLTLRGVRTLVPRMRTHQESALEVARWLSNAPGVEAVHYPGLADHPHHELAGRQMRGYGGMLSFEVAGGAARVERVLRGTHLFAYTGSLGGIDSIISHPATMSHGMLTPQGRAARGIRDNLIRLSIGLEDTPDLIADLHQALAA